MLAIPGAGEETILDISAIKCQAQFWGSRRIDPVELSKTSSATEAISADAADTIQQRQATSAWIADLTDVNLIN